MSYGLLVAVLIIVQAQYGCLDDASLCSADNGDCVSPGICLCDDGYEGTDCMTKIDKEIEYHTGDVSAAGLIWIVLLNLLFFVVISPIIILCCVSGSSLWKLFKEIRAQ